jgi:hypothetical protein
MSARAFWDDGHQVSIPGKVLTGLEAAWRQAERWSVQHFLPDSDAGLPRILDSVEQHMDETVALEAAKKRRSILTHSGPRWSLQPVRPGAQPERDERADYCPWTRGTPLPEGGAWWLVCRMSGLSIPLLPEETS